MWALPVPPARRWACTRADQPRARLPVAASSGLAHGHPCPPLGGACTRAGQRTTPHDDEKMLRAHTGTKPETPIDGESENWGVAPATGPRCAREPLSFSSHASVARTATRPSSQGPASALRSNYCQETSALQSKARDEQIKSSSSTDETKILINDRGNSRENTPTRNQTGLFASPRSLRN